MTEWEKLLQAFRDVVGEPIGEPKASCSEDHRDSAIICRAHRNVWLHGDSPAEKDAQLVVWHGPARIEPFEEKYPGLWFGLSMEFKDVFSQLLPKLTGRSLGNASMRLQDWRLSLGRALRNDGQYYVAHGFHGLAAPDVNYAGLLDEVTCIMGEAHRNHDRSGLPRPHLQIYTRVGAWMDPQNTVPALRTRIEKAYREMTPLLDVITR